MLHSSDGWPCGLLSVSLNSGENAQETPSRNQEAVSIVRSNLFGGKTNRKRARTRVSQSTGAGQGKKKSEKVTLGTRTLESMTFNDILAQEEGSTQLKFTG